MSWIVIALIGYAIASVVAVFDKFLLAKKLDPWQYVIYGGLFGASSLLLIPFGFQVPNYNALIYAVTSGILFLLALYPLYVLINRTEITRANPLVGALVPIFTAIAAYFFLGEELGKLQALSFSLLVIGGLFIIFRPNLLGHSLKNSLLALLAAFLFALSYVAIKASYNGGANFISGYIIARASSAILVSFAVVIFWPKMRKLFSHSKKSTQQKFAWVGANKVLSGISSLVLHYAVFLGSVSLVQALQGIQYVFVLLLGFLVGLVVPEIRERFTFKVTAVKLAAVTLISIGLLILSLHTRPPSNTGEIETYGVTFSTKYVSELGLDYKEVLAALLDELNVRDFRVVAYWPDIEKEKDNYTFNDLDFILDEIEKRDGNVILAIGRKVPRHPECHIPQWIEDPNNENGKTELLNYISDVVSRYKNKDTVVAWQIENEPFLPTTSNLGSCPEFNKDFLDSEIELVRLLDTRPIVVTDSGEIGGWLQAYRRADIFGTSLYRVVHTGLGYFHHISPPEFYFVKENLARLFFADRPIYTIELQAEPWGPEQTYLLDVDERRKSMNIDQLKNNVRFAREVGHPVVYFWGAEWWYWEREQGYDEFWEYMKSIFIYGNE